MGVVNDCRDAFGVSHDSSLDPSVDVPYIPSSAALPRESCTCQSGDSNPGNFPIWPLVPHYHITA